MHKPETHLQKLIEVAAKHLGDAPLTEVALVHAASLMGNFHLRTCLAELYLAGYFGQHDAVSGYAWTMAAWNCGGMSYDDKFGLAETQQYYEFFLSETERTDALRILDGVLPNETRGYIPGNPFNSKWWGWEDDPIPPRPGERDFKEHFVLWLRQSGRSSGEIAEILSRCITSDGPTRSERIQRQVEDDLRKDGFTQDVVTGKWKRDS